MFTVWQISWWITSQPYTSDTTNQTFIPVDVKLSVVGQVIVDDQRHLRNVQTSSPNVSGDQHTALKHTNTHRLSTSPFRYLNQIQKLLTKNKSHSLKWPCDLGNKRVCVCYLAPDLNSFMMDSLSFWGMSPCMDETVKLASLIFSVSQSTWHHHRHHS